MNSLNETSPQTEVLIIGAGPAGLTAAYQLSKQKRPVQVLEKAEIVGGISRTEDFQGYKIDIGGHRFFTKIAEVEAMWHEVLGDDLLKRPRLSRIFFKGKFFFYPIQLWDVIKKLGVIESARILFSYLQYQLFPLPEEENFTQWVSNRFGKRLFETFFQTYTEKVWGIPCEEIKAEWAAQRIKGLTLWKAVWHALMKPKNGKIKTLIHAFLYPRKGPGMLWEKVSTEVERMGGSVVREIEVEKLVIQGDCVAYVWGSDSRGTHAYPASQFISTMPINELIFRMEPAPPVEVLEAARQLTYRDFLTVALVIDQDELFPDNWLYIHSPAVKVGRIQNFKNWSPEMVPADKPHTTCLGLEYFCQVGDALWNREDQDLVRLAKEELVKIGLVDADKIIDGVVFRQPKAYPVYRGEYKESLAIIQAYIDRIPNLQTIGRNGLHMYNNQDHSMLTAMLAVKNLGGVQHNIWSVNTERSYHEEMRVSATES